MNDEMNPVDPGKVGDALRQMMMDMIVDVIPDGVAIPGTADRHALATAALAEQLILPRPGDPMQVHVDLAAVAAARDAALDLLAKMEARDYEAAQKLRRIAGQVVQGVVGIGAGALGPLGGMVGQAAAPAVGVAVTRLLGG